MKRIFSYFAIVVIVAYVAVRGLFGVSEFPYESNKLYVHVLDIGQGDSILIHTPLGKNMLIDGGPGDAVILPISNILGFGLHTIDIMALTHPHADHLSGLIPLFERYAIHDIWYTGVAHTTPIFLEWLKRIKQNGQKIVHIRERQRIEIDEHIFVDILFPDTDISDSAKGVRKDLNLNNTSLVMKLFYGETSFLLVGDAEHEIEKYLLKQPNELRADVLKIGHHGSKTSTSQEFLSAVSPHFAVISVGKNSYGHPDPTVIRRIKEKGIELFRTDVNGTVTFISDGKTISTITGR